MPVSVLVIMAVVMPAIAVYGSSTAWPLDFQAMTQSMWGPGQTWEAFSNSGSTGGSVGITWDVAASTGTVAARFPGQLSAQYSATVPDKGIQNVGVSFTGNPGAGRLSTFLGARFNAYWYIPEDTFSWIPDGLPRPPTGGPLSLFDITAATYAEFTPTLPGDATGIDSDITEVEQNVLGLLEWKLGTGWQQDASLHVDGVTGTLVYEYRNSGIGGSIPFSLDSGSGVELPVDLYLSGDWDLHFEDVHLANTFSTGFDLVLDPYIRVPFWVWDPDPMHLSIYDSPSFGLTFDPFESLRPFSIHVGGINPPQPIAIPAPGGVLLGGMGVGLIGWLRRRRML